MHLLDAEIRRFFSRRLVRLVILLALALITLVQVIQIANGAGRTELQQRPVFSPECEQFQRQAPSTTPPPQSCFTPQRIETIATDHRPNIASHLVDAYQGVGGAFLAFAVLLAASFVGADWASGSVGTLLVFEPRRLRVYLTKLLACILGVLVSGLIVYAWLTFGMWIASATRGTTAGLDGDVVHHAFGALMRVMLVAAIMTSAAYAIASATRHTVAGVGALFGLVIFEQFTIHLLKFLDRISLLPALVWILANELPEGSGTRIKTLGGAIAVAVGWAVAFTILGAALFTRREVR